MAAYGAVASLLHILDDVDSLPFHLRPQMESLGDKVSYLQHSLENCNKKMFEESLEARIRDAVFKAEDIIVSKIHNGALMSRLKSFVDTSLALFNSIKQRKRLHRSAKGYVEDNMGEIIEEIGHIVDEVKRIEDNHGAEGWRQPARNLRSAAASSPSGVKISTGSGKKAVLGFEKCVEETRSRLYDDSLKLEIVPIVGMGGIGKTTLARRVYEASLFDRHFDIHAWTTVSQVYSLGKVLLSLLDTGKMITTETQETEEHKLGENLYKNLKGRRYLIVIDDIWDVDIWDAMRRYFPDDNNRSRVLLTTRLSKVAQYANPNSSLPMSVLNEDDSWNLLCNAVFGEEDCPVELQPIGKEIARNCKGLPLTIAVTSGFLSKMSRTEEDWTSVAHNLSSVVAKDDEKCMEILSLSYYHLPHYLRPCFLYMGMFPEDHEIFVPKLIRLWAAEGFLKPESKSKRPEVLAEECLEDLVERNLVLVGKRNVCGKIQTCKIHDMMWNFCLHRGQKERFLHGTNSPSDAEFVGPVRFSIHVNRHAEQSKILSNIMTRDSSTRSVIYNGEMTTIQVPLIYLGHHILLRVLDLYIVMFNRFPDIITRLVNLRYLAITCKDKLPSSIRRLQNLETLVHDAYGQLHLLPIDIWLMPKLRHIQVRRSWLFGIGDLGFRLENLQSLTGVRNFDCKEENLKRMPNLRELWIAYDWGPVGAWSEYHLECLANLQHLEILNLFVDSFPPFDSKTELKLPTGFAFPQTLSTLYLTGCKIPWERMTIVGSLPCLEVLVLRRNACQGAEWEPNEDEFCQLKYLQLEEMEYLVRWKADETHFPRLRHLTIRSCRNLEEIPAGIGDIPTLERIKLANCQPPVVASAKRIQKEQEDMGNNDLKVVLISTNTGHMDIFEGMQYD